MSIGILFLRVIELVYLNWDAVSPSVLFVLFCLFLEQRKVYCRATKADEVAHVPKSLKLPEGFQQSIFKGQVRDGSQDTWSLCAEFLFALYLFIYFSCLLFKVDANVWVVGREQSYLVSRGWVGYSLVKNGFSRGERNTTELSTWF